MTNISTSFGGTDPSDGDVLYAADWKDTFDEVAEYIANANSRFYSYYESTVEQKGLGIFSDTSWTKSTVKTTDGGVTWGAGGPGDTYDLIRVCRADKTKAIAVTTAGVVKYTTDSGANWSAAGTAPPNITAAWDLAFTTTGVAIIVGNGTGAVDQWRSTDGGNTWAAASAGYNGATYAVDMYDATTGYFINTAGDIYKTTDGGDNWTDTTHNITSATDVTCKMRCISATAFYSSDIQYIQYYNSSGNATAVTQVYSGDVGTISDVIKLSNGYYYSVNISSNAGTYYTAQLLKLDSSVPTSVQVKLVPSILSPNDGFEATTRGKNTLDSNGNNLYLLGSRTIYKFNEPSS